MKKLLFSISCILCMLPAFAQKSLLYKVSGKDLKQPSYLFGTIHMICKDDFFMPDQVKTAFAASKTLYLEMDMDDPAMAQDMMKEMRGGPGYKLANVFTPADYQKLSAFIKDSVKMDIGFFQDFKPLMVMSMVMQKMLTCPTPSSYEAAFVAMAKEQQKPVEGLEKVTDQLHVFDQIPDTTEARMIMQYVNGLPKQQADFTKMVEAYKAQDVNKLYAFMKDSPELTGYEDVLLFNRNRSWIPVIEKAMQKETTIFAFGAMHLGGDQGVISLLRKQGYKVEPVQ